MAAASPEEPSESEDAASQLDHEDSCPAHNLAAIGPRLKGSVSVYVQGLDGRAASGRSGTVPEPRMNLQHGQGDPSRRMNIQAADIKAHERAESAGRHTANHVPIAGDAARHAKVVQLSRVVHRCATSCKVERPMKALPLLTELVA